MSTKKVSTDEIPMKRHPSLPAAGAMTGAVAGAITGAAAGPVGAVVGAAVGAAVGGMAAVAIDGEMHRQSLHDGELDKEIGVADRDLGAAPVTIPPPSPDEEEGRKSLDLLEQLDSVPPEQVRGATEARR